MSDGLGFDRAQLIHGSTYRDSSTVVIVPTRGMIHHRVAERLMALIAPMNQKKHFLFVAGDEVGRAYDRAIEGILAHPELSKWKYVLTLEDDNLPPPDAHIRLLESIEEFKLDAVSGIYFTKGEVNMPMAYGDPARNPPGCPTFEPLDPLPALKAGNRVQEVNGIAMGCALWRMDLFREIPKPWFVSVADYFPEKGGIQAQTQDLYFCAHAKKRAKRFGVDYRVRVGHMDVATEIVY